MEDDLGSEVSSEDLDSSVTNDKSVSKTIYAPITALWKYCTTGQKVQLFVGCLCSILYGFSLPVSEYVFANAFDNTAPNKPNEERERLVRIDSRNMLLVAIAYALICSISVWIWTSLSQQVTDEVKKRYFKQLLSQDMEWYDINNP